MSISSLDRMKWKFQRILQWLRLGHHFWKKKSCELKQSGLDFGWKMENLITFRTARAYQNEQLEKLYGTRDVSDRPVLEVKLLTAEAEAFDMILSYIYTDKIDCKSNETCWACSSISLSHFSPNQSVHSTVIASSFWWWTFTNWRCSIWFHDWSKFAFNIWNSKFPNRTCWMRYSTQTKWGEFSSPQTSSRWLLNAQLIPVWNWSKNIVSASS